MANADLTAQRLRELLDYDPETGIFKWKVAVARRVKVGDTTGCIDSDGYLQIRVNDRLYRAHRLAWFYMHSNWPTGHIDHINGTKVDNRIVNLRDVTPSVNKQNMRIARRDNRTGFLGVSANSNHFQARIWHSGKLHSIGMFDTAEEAHAAYVEAKRRLHEGCTL